MENLLDLLAHCTSEELKIIKYSHEKDYLESKRGKYNRSSKKSKNHKSIIPLDGNMINNFSSFVEAYSNGMK